MKRADLTEKILDIKREKGWSWKYLKVVALIQDLHGGNCGRSGAQGPCRSITYWNGEEFTPAHPLQ